MSTNGVRYGDLFERLEGQAFREILHDDGGIELLCNLSGSGDDDFYVGLCGFERLGAYRPWTFYSRQTFRERVAALSPGGDLAGLGRSEPVVTADAVVPPAEPQADRREVKPDPGNKLQTAQEATLAVDPRVVEAMGRFFQAPVIGQCDPQFKPTFDALQVPSSSEPGAPMVPVTTVGFTCQFGNPQLIQTVFANDQTGLARPKICSTRFRLELTRRVTFEHVQKSTKLGIGIGLGMTTKGGLQLTGAQIGGPVFSENKLAADASTGQELKFNFDMVKQHAKLKVDAFERLVVEVPEIVCAVL